MAIDVDGEIVTLFVNHLKSMINTREETRPKRERQAAGVRKIIEERFGANPGKEKFIVLGDMNDYPEEDAQGKSGIKALVEWDQVENVIDRIPDPEDRWTHFYAKRKDYKQLDYILLSKALAKASDAVPEIMRKGSSQAGHQVHGPAFRRRRRGQAEGLRPLPDGGRGRGRLMGTITAPGVDTPFGRLTSLRALLLVRHLLALDDLWTVELDRVAGEPAAAVAAAEMLAELVREMEVASSACRPPLLKCVRCSTARPGAVRRQPGRVRRGGQGAV